MKPKTVEEYINGFPTDQKVKLVELHKIIRTTLPNTTEELKWGAPASIDQSGMILIIFSEHKDHMSFVVTPSTKSTFEKELADYETGKGSVKLKYDKSVPTDLIKRMILFRAKEYREDGVNWKL